MTMPGFNADVSLHKSRGSYYGGGLYAFAGSGGVVPQLPKQTEECYAWCNLSGEDPLTCFFRCGSGFPDAGGGNGGGGGSGGAGGDLVCGPCNKRTGLQRCGIPGKGFKFVPCGLND